MSGKNPSKRPNDNDDEELSNRRNSLEDLERAHAQLQEDENRGRSQPRSSGGHGGREGSRGGIFHLNENVQDDTQSLVPTPTPDGTLGSGMSRVNSLSSLPSGRSLDRATTGSLGNESIDPGALGSNDGASTNPPETGWSVAPTPDLLPPVQYLDPGVAALDEHKAFEPTTGSSSFKYADIEVSSIPQSKQRIYLEEFYRSKLGLSDEKIEEHRLSIIIFFFTELAKRGYNYIPESFSWLGVDNLTWTYVFKDHDPTKTARPTFPFKTPELEDDKTSPRCPAFDAWRVVCYLKPNDKDMQSMPVLDISGRPASRFGVTTSYECRVLLDSTRNAEFYQVQNMDLNETMKEVPSKKTSTSEWSAVKLSGQERDQAIQDRDALTATFQTGNPYLILDIDELTNRYANSKIHAKLCEDFTRQWRENSIRCAARLEKASNLDYRRLIKKVGIDNINRMYKDFNAEATQITESDRRYLRIKYLVESGKIQCSLNRF